MQSVRRRDLNSRLFGHGEQLSGPQRTSAGVSASATGVHAVLAVFTDNLRGGRLEPRIAERWDTLTDL